MTDLISRQAVMDATKAVMKDVLDSMPTRLEDGEEVYDVRTSELDFILNTNKALQNAIKALPSETHDLRTETHGVCSDELISRQAALDAISTFGNREYRRKQGTLQDAYKLISALPSAEPKTGEWIDEGDPLTLRCSKCDYRVARYNNTNYCPNCGSRMRGGNDD